MFFEAACMLNNRFSLLSMILQELVKRTTKVNHKTNVSLIFLGAQTSAGTFSESESTFCIVDSRLITFFVIDYDCMKSRLTTSSFG